MFVETDSSHDSELYCNVFVTICTIVQFSGSSPSSEEGDRVPVFTLNNLEDGSTYHVESGRCSDDSEATPKRPRNAHHHHQSPDCNVRRQTLTTSVNILENDLGSVTGKPESMENNGFARSNGDPGTEEEQAEDRGLTRKQEVTNNLDTSSDEDQYHVVIERDESLFNGSVDSANSSSKGRLDSRLLEPVVTSEHSMSQEETSEAVEPSLQVPPQHFNLSNTVDIVVRPPAYLRLEKSQSDENLEVVPCSNSDIEEMVAPSLNDLQREKEQYGCLSGNSTDEDQLGSTNNCPPATNTPSVEAPSVIHSTSGTVHSLVVEEESSADEPNQWIDLSQVIYLWQEHFEFSQKCEINYHLYCCIVHVLVHSFNSLQ